MAITAQELGDAAAFANAAYSDSNKPVWEISADFKSEADFESQTNLANSVIIPFKRLEDKRRLGLGKHHHQGLVGRDTLYNVELLKSFDKTIWTGRSFLNFLGS